MIQACEQCGARIPDDRIEPLCDRCGIAMAWPGFLRLLALAPLLAGLARLALRLFR
jgi:hypothetical protein